MESKSCFKCGTDKPLDEFYKHPRMADGRLGKCKDCTKADSHRRRQDKLDEVRAYDRERAKHPERMRAMSAVAKQWRQADRRRGAAHNAVAHAIRSGRLVRQPCERCGDPNSYAHHEDYDKKLDVNWLCQPCHKQRHRELKEAQMDIRL